MAIQLPVDGAGKQVETNTPDGTTHRQVVSVGDKTTAANTLAIDASGRITSNVNGTVSVRATDGTNAISKTFDEDTSGVTHEYLEGVSLRKSGSGGSVELGTSTAPLRIDPTGSTVQPVSGTFWQTTQPVSGTFWQSTQPVSIASMPSTPVTGTFWQATQPVQFVGNGAVASGQQAVTASSVALGTQACRKVSIKALIGNTITVYVGPTGITTGTGFPLDPGESVTLDVTNVNLAFVIASTTGASVAWIATN